MATKSMPDLSGFTGTERHHRLTLNRRLLATDGVAHLAKEVGAFWLCDAIASHLKAATAGRVLAEPAG